MSRSGSQASEPREPVEEVPAPVAVEAPIPEAAPVEAVPPSPKAPVRASRDAFKVVVRNFPEATTRDDLGALFASVGKIEDLHVGNSRNGTFGFVGFSSDEELQAALAMNGQEYNGTTLLIEKKPDRDQERRQRAERDQLKIFVKGFPEGTTESELKEYFGRVGTVNDMHVASSREGPFAFVGFAEAAEHEAALNMNGQAFGGRPIIIERKNAGDKNRRDAPPGARRDGPGGRAPRNDDRRSCFKCGEVGHISRDCRGGGGGGGGDMRRRGRDGSRERFGGRREDSRDRYRRRDDSRDRYRRREDSRDRYRRDDRDTYRRDDRDSYRRRDNSRDRDRRPRDAPRDAPRQSRY